jgi:hypothetical protein
LTHFPHLKLRDYLSCYYNTQRIDTEYTQLSNRTNIYLKQDISMVRYCHFVFFLHLSCVYVIYRTDVTGIFLLWGHEFWKHIPKPSYGAIFAPHTLVKILIFLTVQILHRLLWTNSYAQCWESTHFWIYFYNKKFC